MTALADVNTDAAAALGKDFGFDAAVYADYAEMLANVLIATSSYGGDFTQLRREPNTIRGMS